MSHRTNTNATALSVRHAQKTEALQQAFQRITTLQIYGADRCQIAGPSGHEGKNKLRVCVCH